MKEFNVLIIDDEEAQLASLKSFLSKRSYSVFTSVSGEEGYNIVKENQIDIILTDFQMPGWNGLDVVKNIKQLNPGIDIVVMTAYGTIETAVTLMKEGAYDYLIKPINLDELESVLNKIKERQFLLSENTLLKSTLNEKFKFESIITHNSDMEKVLNTAGRVAQSKSTVLILGESGSGKELIAKAIHYTSPRKEKPFVIVNVASLSENLIESELFGHEKGSFTGAVNKRIGRFEEADGGTLFIDEVGDIPLSAQVKLLRAIQFGELQRLGGNQTIKTDVRIIAATHKNLEERIDEGSFRQDLFYRLNVVPIIIPPLRSRKDDIPLLIDSFINKHFSSGESKVSGISREALDLLVKYNFPGNVRELENIIERAAVLCRGEIITKEDLPDLSVEKKKNDLFDPSNLELDYESKMKAFEKALIEEALNRANGNKSAAARLIGITERHLRSRLERLDN
jgi:two-component system NtrC family response regulator